MKLFYKMLSEPLDFDTMSIHTLVIENPKLYRQAILSLLQQEDDVEDAFVLSDENGSLSLNRLSAVVTDPFCIDCITDKRIVGAIQKELAQVATYELGDEVAKIFVHIHQFLSSLVNLSTHELCFDDGTDPMILIHTFHVRPDVAGMSFCEKLLHFMELMSEYCQKRLFIFCGLHGCLSESEMQSFLQDLIYRKFYVLLLESHDCVRYSRMKKTVIDVDLCEI